MPTVNNDEDKIVKYMGERLKLIRLSVNGTQRALASHLDISFQQVQKYESGSNRIPSPILFKIAKFYNVTPNYFYKDLLADLPSTTAQQDHEDVIALMLMRPQNMMLMKSVCSIEDDTMRKKLYGLIELISQQDKELRSDI